MRFGANGGRMLLQEKSGIICGALKGIDKLAGG